MAIVKAEAGVAMPPVHGNAKYPWREMGVGESFRVEALSPNGHYTLAHLASRNYAPKKFKAGKDESGNRRVWRTE